MKLIDGRQWIERVLLNEQGFPVETRHELDLHKSRLPSDAYQTRTIGRNIDQVVTRWGSLRELLGKLTGSQTGLWYYIGWIDQAVLHIGKVESGTADLLPAMLRQFDEDQVDQGGDMTVGFACSNREWIFEIAASPDNDDFCVSIRSNFINHIASAKATLGISEA